LIPLAQLDDVASLAQELGGINKLSAIVRKLRLDSGTYSTPRWVVDAVGFDFTLDACALSSNTQCQRYFSPEADGLQQDWGDNVVWCNPPFYEIERWAHKCYSASKGGATVAFCVPAWVGNPWWSYCSEKAAELRTAQGTVRFSSPVNKTARHNVAVWIFRPTKRGRCRIGPQLTKEVTTLLQPLVFSH
jgi:phage N-6-adenine-methyltransferase